MSSATEQVSAQEVAKKRNALWTEKQKARRSTRADEPRAAQLSGQNR